MDRLPATVAENRISQLDSMFIHPQQFPSTLRIGSVIVMRDGRWIVDDYYPDRNMIVVRQWGKLNWIWRELYVKAETLVDQDGEIYTTWRFAG
jgi:hypothetical protein